MAHTCLHWFRKGLRLHDNPALMAALRDCEELYPVFILDPHLHNKTCVGLNRWRFLIGALTDLDCSLRKLNSRLFVVRGKPDEVFPKLFNKWKITKLTYEYDTEPYSLSRDTEVTALAKEHGVEVIYKISHTLYDINRIIEENNGAAPLTYKRLQAIANSLGPPKRPIPPPTLEDMEGVKTPRLEKHEKKYGIPSLEELGHDTTALTEELFPGGEQEALRRLDEHMKRTGWVCSFEKPQTSPNSLSPSTTVLSPYVTFGCLSARTFWWRLTDVYQGKKHSHPPVSLHGQLLWREFFYTASVGIPNFNKMEGNPACTQVDWDTNAEYLAAWREVFEDLLLDGDWALNAGNWQWLSASTFFHQFFRVYSPVAFGKKTDKNGAYIKKYLPLLKKFPAEYIYEPWKAPRSIQQAAGCIVGKDYPHPIVQHEVVSKKNIQRMKLAYARRSSDPTESPSKKQGVKRKAPSVVDMLMKKKRKI
uniref:Photolyase/cryptochrome alpha/beta domain-containing protein n=1 Tax=Anabas testudineus TaxID=64144 RepID=A0A3Q1J0D1_ANATE